MSNKEYILKKQILSFSEATIYLDISKSFLYKITSSRSIPFAKPNGGKIYFKKTDLDNWMLSNTSKSVSIAELEILNHLKKNSNE